MPASDVRRSRRLMSPGSVIFKLKHKTVKVNKQKEKDRLNICCSTKMENLFSAHLQVLYVVYVMSLTFFGEENFIT